MKAVYIRPMVRSKSSSIKVIKLSRKTTINSSNTPTQPKCLITTHYIGNLENKFGMFTREQTPHFNFTSREKIILKFTNSKLNSLVHSPKTNIKYQEIPIQDAANSGIDRFLHSINFSFQTNLNLFHSSSSRNLNEGNQVQALKEKNNNNSQNNNNILMERKSRLMNNKPPYTDKLRNIGRIINKSKEKKVKYYEMKVKQMGLNKENKDIKDRQEHHFLPTINKKMMFRKRNYTQSDFCSLYSLFYLNSPKQKVTNGCDLSKQKYIQIFNKSKFDALMHHNTDLPLY